MKVKICGITDLTTALYAVEQGADALGFVFAESKRKVTMEQAKRICERIPDSVLKVGVFVNESKGFIEETVNVVGLTAIQLHGDETPEFCNDFSLPVIKAFSIKEKEDTIEFPYYSCEYFLLDSPRGKYFGGNGTAFDWNLISNIDWGKAKIILAGGLSHSNVEQAIRIVHPYMVDVSSGVETNGKKDYQKIKEFIKKAKGALEEEIK